MNFITMLCLALANCEQFMSLSNAEDHGVSARSDLAEIDDLNLTAPSPLQRLLSADDDDEEEEDEAEEDEENEEADESEVEDGKKVWSNPQVGMAAGVAGLAAGIAGVYGGHYLFGAKPKAPAAVPEPTVELTVAEAHIAEFKKNYTDKFGKQTDNAEAKTLEVTVTLQQLKELNAWKIFITELQKEGITLATAPAAPAAAAATGDAGDGKTGDAGDGKTGDAGDGKTAKAPKKD